MSRLALDDKKMNLVLAAIFLGALVGIIATARGSDALALFLVVIIFFFMLVLLSWQPDARLRNILLIALLMRIGLAMFNAYIAPLPDSGADAVTFERLGWDTARAWLGDGIVPDLSGANLYSALIGIVYYLFGRANLIPQLLNVLFGVTTVYIVYRLTLRIFSSRRTSQIAALLAAFFPTLNLYSAITMRENLIVMCTTASVYSFIKWLQRGIAQDMMLSVILLLLASAFHSGMIFIGGAYIFFFSFYNPKRKCWDLISVRLLVVLVLVFFCLTTLSGQLLAKLPSDISLLVSPEYLSERIAVTARDRAVYLPGLTPQSIVDLFLQTPLRVIYFLYTPFPWMVSNLSDVAGLLDALLYFVLTIYGIKGVRSIAKRDKVIAAAIVMIAFTFLVTFAWGTSNYGTALRHRQKLVWLLISIASIGISQSLAWKWLLPYPVGNTEITRPQANSNSKGYLEGDQMEDYANTT